MPLRLSLLCLVLFGFAVRADDPHSFSQPQSTRVRHLDLDLTVDFERQVLHGHVTLSVVRNLKKPLQPLILDTRGLKIEKVEVLAEGKEPAAANFELGKEDPVLGRSLTIELPDKVKTVTVHYRTTPQSAALQWLDREQTASKKHPFLFTQSQAIHARSWIPLQDSPGVRVTYTARIRSPKGLRAVMSASNDPQAALGGVTTFEMKQPIPPYLIALAVGELEFHKIGPRTGVYGESGVAKKAAEEFSDLEKMLEAVEKLYGPYRWERYDVLVLPPSFPFGGMENPRLTFASPTVLAGDKSLVALIAHELAHSWSGNLVSNATWRDFWLNEGFTVYLERRITEAVYGKARAEVQAVLGRRSLEREMAEMKPADQVLHIDLTGRDPEEGLTDVPYEKGALFLKHLEQTFGRERFDAFLKGYFGHFAFQSITTADFVAYLQKHLLDKYPELAKKVPVQEWLHKPGLPGVAPRQTAESLEKVSRLARSWLEGKVSTRELKPDDWSTQEWLHFLEELPAKVGRERMKELDGAFGLTKRGNSEITFAWLLLAIRNDYEPAFARLEEFLTTQGRRKFLQPLYAELVKTAAGRERAAAIYKKARPTYHPISVNTIDAILKGDSKKGS